MLKLENEILLYHGSYTEGSPIDLATTEKQMETCAVSTMRRMIEKYSEKMAIPFEDAFFQFTNSCVYNALFDFETGIWMEGPDYLMALYEDAIQSA